MKYHFALFLTFSILLASGCVTVPVGDDKTPSLNLDVPSDSNDSVVDDIQQPMKKIYNTVKKGGLYEGNYINLSWRLEDEREGFTPSSNKLMCAEFDDYPSGDDLYVPVGGEVFSRFNADGYAVFSIYTNTPGKYVFKICGIGYLMDDEFIDEGTYAGDGDAIEVVVPEKPEIFIGESSFELLGPFSDGRYYEIHFKWDLEFFDKSTEGICAIVGHNLVETRFWSSDLPNNEGHSNTWKCEGNTLIAKSGSEADFDGPITVKVSLWKFPDRVIYKGGGEEIVAIIPKRERV